jgi:hypothetical protein
VNRVSDQLFTGARFSLDQNRGIRRRDTLDLIEHRLQSGTTAYDSLKAALSPILIVRPDLLLAGSHSWTS